MLLEMMVGKIHRATVTDANLNYMGSVTVDEELIKAAGFLEHQKVQIVNNNNGARLETYLIKGRAGSGTICLNGAAARCAQKGDIVIIIGYALMTPEEAEGNRPKVIFVDQDNHFLRNGKEDLPD